MLNLPQQLSVPFSPLHLLLPSPHYTLQTYTAENIDVVICKIASGLSGVLFNNVHMCPCTTPPKEIFIMFEMREGTVEKKVECPRSMPIICSVFLAVASFWCQVSFRNLSFLADCILNPRSSSLWLALGYHNLNPRSSSLWPALG